MGFFSDLKTRRALALLSDQVETLERQLKSVRLEWEDTYEKLRRIAGRIDKRAERAREDAEARSPGSSGNGEPPAEELEVRTGPSGAGLTPRQRQIQQEILRRRAGIGG